MNTSEAGRRLIDGRFELLGRIGSGGMGTVWRARDIVLHREVALKEVRTTDLTMAETDPAKARILGERMLREARALARLTHPHVVTIHQIVESPDATHPWIVMELVPGQSLHERLAQGPLTVSEALEVGRGVLSALRAAHAEGIHHRDVKPANVLLRPDRSPVLTDFGIAALRESTALTATGDLIGSPEYIAPERIRGQEGNPASDLWSLGMLLYVALEGWHPLRRDTSISTLVAVLDEPIPPPVRSGPLSSFLTSLLVRDAAARPDAAQLECMLADAAENPADRPSKTVPRLAVPRVSPAAQPAQPGPYHTPPSSNQPFGYGRVAFGTVPDAQPPGPLPQPPAPRRKPWTTLVAVTIAAAALAAASVIALNAISHDGDPADGTQEKSASAGGVTDENDSPATAGNAPSDAQRSTEASLPPSKQTKNLLTPDSVRGAVTALKAEAGTTKFFELTVYKEHAIAEVPVQGSRTKYDRYVYQNGYAAKEGPGGTIIGTNEGPIDVSKVNWDMLPALIKKADQELGIPEPTMRYVIIRGPVFENVPTINIYLTDEYNSSGYLTADFNGSVLNKAEAES